MISLDTNVVVRALTQDDPKQAKKAAALLGSGSVFVTKTVLVEVEWVLRGAYGFGRAPINEALRKLVGLTGLEVEDRPAVTQALTWHAAGMDLADALNLASSSGCASFATFDASLAKSAARVGAVPWVRMP